MTLGIYVQVPFCQTKCTYCNFHTGVFSSSLFAPYVSALCKELAARASSLSLKVDSVYVGGGTPSLLDPPTLARILGTLRAHYDCELVEVTLESAPETVTPEKALAWRQTGFNRISLGVQSFANEELQVVGRLHRQEDIFNATRFLREARFANISLDLIAGLPEQTTESWEDSLDQLFGLRPEHVSIYLLEIDQGSRLGREVLVNGQRYSAPEVPSDDAMAEFYERACRRLETEGYEHYEISNWAMPGHRSHHNLKYWRREPYLGIGAGAHSFDGARRWANTHDPAAYVARIEQGGSPVEEDYYLTPREALEEELFLGLRQLEGISLRRIEKKYGVRLEERIRRLEKQGLVEIDGEQLRLSPARLAVSNEVFVELIVECGAANEAWALAAKMRD